MACSSEVDMEVDMEIVDDNGESLNLDARYTSIPLEALRTSARKKISLYLDNTSEIVDDETGYVTDWNGLAELVGFNSLEMKRFGRQKSPTAELFLEWETTPALNPTLGNLWKNLIELGRIDVIQDCRNIVVKDAENYIQTKERLASDYIPVQVDSISQSTAPDHYIDESRMLVTGDIDGSITLFDAFVCYNTDSRDKDISFVKEMISKLEKQYGLSLCIPGRDDLPGGCKYVADAKLIESRCRRMIIILSHEYLHSSACDFQVKFAHALAPGARSKRLIPVLIEPSVPIPQILRHVTLCDYTKQDLMEWFWDRLAKSVKAPLDPETLRQTSSSSSISSSPISISSNSSMPSLSSSQSMSVSPASMSGIGEFRISEKNTDHMFDDASISSDSGYTSGRFSSSVSSASAGSNDSSFNQDYISLSADHFPAESSVGRNSRGKKNILGKFFKKKNNSHTSSHA